MDTLPEEYQILCHILSNLLLSLPLFLKHPPDFMPSEKFTTEQMEKMDINPSGFLWPEEHKLVLFLIKEQEAAIAWNLSEWGNFRRIIRAHCHPHSQAHSMGRMKYSYTTRDIQ